MISSYLSRGPITYHSSITRLTLLKERTMISLRKLWPNPREWQQWSRPSKLTLIGVVIGLLALLPFPAGCMINWVQAWRANPRPTVTANETETEISICVRTHSPATSMAIDFPVVGRIKAIHDYNSPTDAVVTSKTIEGANLPNSQNNAQITLTDIKPQREISFKILYEPTPTDFVVAGTDRWHFSYSWLYNGATEARSKWLRIDNGQEVDPPRTEIRGATIVPHALSPEEIRKLYQQGPVRNQPVPNPLDH